MAGELCDGLKYRNANPIDSKAMCEGALARSQSTTPTNPHAAGSDAANAWEYGAVQKGLGVDPPCCAPCGPAALSLQADPADDQ